MKLSHNYWVYMMASWSGTLYIGVTNNLQRRVYEHKNKFIDGFSKKYSCVRLIYAEHFKQIQDAIVREKQLKNWNRKKKEWLINKENPSWNDLSLEWQISESL